MQRQDYTHLRLRQEPPSSVDILRRASQKTADGGQVQQKERTSWVSQENNNQQPSMQQQPMGPPQLDGKSSRHTGSSSSFVANLMARAGVVNSPLEGARQTMQPPKLEKYAFDDIHPDFHKSQVGYPNADAANQQQQSDRNRRPGNQNSELMDGRPDVNEAYEDESHDDQEDNQEQSSQRPQVIKVSSPPKNLTPQRESASRNAVAYRSSSFQGNMPNQAVNQELNQEEGKSQSSPFRALRKKKFSGVEGSQSFGENEQYELSSIPHVPQSATVGGLSQYYIDQTARNRTSGLVHNIQDGYGSEIFAPEPQNDGVNQLRPDSFERDFANKASQPAQRNEGSGGSPGTCQVLDARANQSTPSADLHQVEQMMQFHQRIDQPMPRQGHSLPENQYLAQLEAHRSNSGPQTPQDFNIYYDQMKQQDRLPTTYVPSFPHVPSQERIRNHHMLTLDAARFDDDGLLYKDGGRYYSNERDPNKVIEMHDPSVDLPIRAPQPARKQKPGYIATSIGRGSARPRTGGPTPKSTKRSLLYQGHTRSSAAKRITGGNRGSFQVPSGPGLASPQSVISQPQLQTNMAMSYDGSHTRGGSRERLQQAPPWQPPSVIAPSTTNSVPNSILQTMQSRKFSPAQSQRSGQRLYNNAKIVESKKIRAQMERDMHLKSMMKIKPTICKKSKKIVEAKAQLETEEWYMPGREIRHSGTRSSVKASESSGPQRFRNHQHCYHNSKVDDEDAECTHKPRINKKSRSLIENMVAENIRRKNQLARGYQKANGVSGTLDARDAVGKQLPTQSFGGHSSRSLKMGSFTNATISAAGESGPVANVVRPSQGMVAKGCSPQYPISWPAPVPAPSSMESQHPLSKQESGRDHANRALFTFQQNGMGTLAQSSHHEPSPMRGNMKESQGTLRLPSTEKDTESRVQLNQKFRDLDQQRAMRPPSTDRNLNQPIQPLHIGKVMQNQREYMMSPVEISYNNGIHSPKLSEPNQNHGLFTIGQVDQAQQLPESKQPFLGASDHNGKSLRERIEQRVAAERNKSQSQERKNAAKIQNEVIKLNAKQLERVRDSMRRQTGPNIFQDKRVRPRRNDKMSASDKEASSQAQGSQSFQGNNVKKTVRNDAIYRKSMEWLSRIDKKLEDEREIKQKVEMEACSFTPNLGQSAKVKNEDFKQYQEANLADYHIFRAERAPHGYKEIAQHRAISSQSKGTVSTVGARGQPQLRVEQRAISRGTIAGHTDYSGIPHSTKAADGQHCFTNFDVSRKSLGASSDNRTRFQQPTAASRSKIISPDHKSGRLTPQHNVRSAYSRQSVSRTVQAISTDSPIKTAMQARKVPGSFMRRPYPSQSPSGKVSIGPMRTLSPRPKSGTSQPPKPSGRQEKVFGNKKATKKSGKAAARTQVKQAVGGIVDLRMSRVFGSTSKSNSQSKSLISPIYGGNERSNIVTTFGGQQELTHDQDMQLNKLSSISNLPASQKSQTENTLDATKFNQWQGGITKIKEDSMDKIVSARSIQRVGSQYLPPNTQNLDGVTVNQKSGDSDDLNLESIDDRSVFVNININDAALVPFPDRRQQNHQEYQDKTNDASQEPSTVKQPTNFELFQKQMGRRMRYFNESETHSQSHAGNFGQSNMPGFRFSEVREFNDKTSKSPSGAGNPLGVATPSEVDPGIDSHRLSSINIDGGLLQYKQRSSVNSALPAMPDEFTLAKPMKRVAPAKNVNEPSDFSPTERSNPPSDLPEGGMSRQAAQKDSVMQSNDWQYSASHHILQGSQARNSDQISPNHHLEQQVSIIEPASEVDIKAQQQHIADQIQQAEEAIGLVHVNEEDEEDESRMSSAYIRRSQRGALARTGESGLQRLEEQKSSINNGSRASYGFLKQVADIDPSEYNFMLGSHGPKKSGFARTDESSKNTIDHPTNAIAFFERQNQMLRDIDGYHSRQDRKTLEDMGQGRQPSGREFSTQQSGLPPRSRPDLAVVTPTAFNPAADAVAVTSNGSQVRTTKNSQQTQPMLTSLPPTSLLSNSLEFSGDRRHKNNLVAAVDPSDLQDMSRELVRQNREVEQIRDEIRKLNQKQIEK